MTTTEQPEPRIADHAGQAEPREEQIDVGLRFSAHSLICVWFAILAFAFIAKVAWGFDADELQNLHFAWNISQGKLPFRDFFEHHPPLLHYVLAPIVSGMDQPSWGLLIGMRVAALIVAAAIIFCFHGLLRRSLPKVWAAVGVGILVLTHPFGSFIFELRADWIALVALIGAVSLMADALAGAGRWAWLAAASGLLIGLGICLTQKTAFLGSGLIVWACLAGFAAPVPRLRSIRFWTVAIVVVGAAVGPLLVGCWFALQGALPALIEHTIRVNLRWASEGTWRYTVNESLLPMLPIAALAIARLIRISISPKRHLQSASPESACAALLLFGAASLLTTPVPHGQSYLFLVAPWAALLSAHALKEIGESSGWRRFDWQLLVVGVLIALTAVKPISAAAGVLVWGSALWILQSRRAGPLWKTRSLQRLAFASMALSAVVFVGRCVDSLARHEAFVQSRVIQFAHAATPRGEPVLNTWPLITPFRPQPTFHGFARRGPAQTIGVAALSEEYAAALRSGASRECIVDDVDIRRQLPAFGLFLDDECRRIPGCPRNRDRLTVYIYAGPARR